MTKTDNEYPLDPSVTFDENVIHIYNSKVYPVGKHTLDAAVNLRDDVNGAIRLCVEQIEAV